MRRRRRVRAPAAARSAGSVGDSTDAMRQNKQRIVAARVNLPLGRSHAPCCVAYTSTGGCHSSRCIRKRAVRRADVCRGRSCFLAEITFFACTRVVRCRCGHATSTCLFCHAHITTACRARAAAVCSPNVHLSRRSGHPHARPTIAVLCAAPLPPPRRVLCTHARRGTTHLATVTSATLAHPRPRPRVPRACAALLFADERSAEARSSVEIATAAVASP
jgi:hypothetical protein